MRASDKNLIKETRYKKMMPNKKESWILGGMRKYKGTVLRKKDAAKKDNFIFF